MKKDFYCTVQLELPLLKIKYSWSASVVSRGIIELVCPPLGATTISEIDIVFLVLLTSLWKYPEDIIENKKVI